MSKFLQITLCVLMPMLVFNACKVTKKSEKPIVIKPITKLEEQAAETLLKNIVDSAFYGKWISGKATVNTNIEGDKNNFNVSLRICRDSAIWISVSPLLGIEAVRILLTQDTVRFLDRINKEYKVSGYKEINDLLFAGNLDFDIVQGILTGNLFVYKRNKFHSVYLEDQYYILSTLSKRKLKRSLEEKDPSKPVIQDFYVDGSNYRIMKLAIEDSRIQKSLITKYSGYSDTSAGFFPYHSVTNIKAEKNILVDIEYTKVSVEDTLEFPFNIPKSFKKAR
ncbi:MAG: DUF4292 domain-containing protein [Bacteroidia bacterium]